MKSLQVINEGIEEGGEANEQRLTALSAELLLAVEQTWAASQQQVDGMHADLVRALGELGAAVHRLEHQATQEADATAHRQAEVESRLETTSTDLERTVGSLAERLDARVGLLSAGLRVQRLLLIGLSALVVLLAVLVVVIGR